MAKLQIVTTDENDGGNACEALWYAMAKTALTAGHEIEVSINRRAAAHPEIRELAAMGARFRYRWAEPPSGKLLPLLHKIWCRTGRRMTLSRAMNSPADLRILNVGTQVEVAREPWADFLGMSGTPFAAIIHSNSEIRDYPSAVTQRLSLILAKARRVYFVSDRLRENAEEQLVMKIPGAVTIRNPVNLTSRAIEPWPEEDGTLRLAVVGRLDTFVKGHIRLLHALSTDIWKSRRWTLSIFGDGPDLTKINRAIDFYGLRDRISFGGFVKDLRASVWKSHHLLVMPSMLEGMPLTLVEAMICGRPALCSDVGGASELLVDGGNGFLAGSPFARQLEHAMERMWEIRDQLPAMGLRAHADATAYIPESPGAVLLADVLAAIEPVASSKDV